MLRNERLRFNPEQVKTKANQYLLEEEVRQKAAEKLAREEFRKSRPRFFGRIIHRGLVNEVVPNPVQEAFDLFQYVDSLRRVPVVNRGIRASSLDYVLGDNTDNWSAVGIRTSSFASTTPYVGTIIVRAGAPLLLVVNDWPDEQKKPWQEGPNNIVPTLQNLKDEWEGKHVSTRGETQGLIKDIAKYKRSQAAKDLRHAINHNFNPYGWEYKYFDGWPK